MFNAGMSKKGKNFLQGNTKEIDKMANPEKKIYIYKPRPATVYLVYNCVPNYDNNYSRNLIAICESLNYVKDVILEHFCKEHTPHLNDLRINIDIEGGKAIVTTKYVEMWYPINKIALNKLMENK